MVKSTISVLVKRYRDRKTPENKYRSGRPNITTEHQDRILVRKSKQDPRKSAVKLNDILSKNCGVKCSVDITKCCLHQHNLFDRRPAMKLLVDKLLGERFAPKYQMPTVKHGGGNVMVWILSVVIQWSTSSFRRHKGSKCIDIIKTIMMPHGKDKKVSWLDFPARQ